MTRRREAYRVHPTKAGQALTRSIIPVANALNAKATACLSAKERELLLDLLDRLRGHLQDA